MSLPDTDQILEGLSFFDTWEERYKYIIDLGKSLPDFPEALHTPERLVKGCQSNVWLEVDKNGDKLTFTHRRKDVARHAYNLATALRGIDYYGDAPAVPFWAEIWPAARAASPSASMAAAPRQTCSAAMVLRPVRAFT